MRNVLLVFGLLLSLSFNAQTKFKHYSIPVDSITDKVTASRNEFRLLVIIDGISYETRIDSVVNNKIHFHLDNFIKYGLTKKSFTSLESAISTYLQDGSEVFTLLRYKRFNLFTGMMLN